MKDYKATLQSKQRALAIRIKLFGEEHESTADSYRTLGVTQHEMKDYKAALQSEQRALAIRIKLFGEEHESTAETRSKISISNLRLTSASTDFRDMSRSLGSVKNTLIFEHFLIFRVFHLNCYFSYLQFIKLTYIRFLYHCI